MARLVLCCLVLFVSSGFSKTPDKYPPGIIADQEFLQKQTQLLYLYYHVNQPASENLNNSWFVEKEIENFKNVSAVKVYIDLMDFGWTLPRNVPFSILEKSHRFEAISLFNFLLSAKDFATLYRAAACLRGRVNEGLFVYVLAAVTMNHPDTQDILIPPLYNILPSYFHNGEIMTIAREINAYGKEYVEKYPWSTYLWEDNVVIRWNDTTWAYNNKDWPVQHYTHDYALNTLYYNFHLTYPFWLSGDVSPLTRFQRGEYCWFFHKQFLTRYYMERLSSGLGEIPEIDWNEVEQGYSSGLLYPNGVPFPSRPNHFSLNQEEYVDLVQNIKEFEGRIRKAIDLGYFFDTDGKRVSLRTPESINTIANIIEGNVDSGNLNYFGDFIQLWKTLLSNSYVPGHQYKNGIVSLVVPGTLENYQTAFRDPAFYMIWKRALKLFNHWQSYLPAYKSEELSMPTVTIQKVEVTKLLTYFENVFLNVTNELYMNKWERKADIDEISVLVERAQLSYKPYEVRINVKNDVAQKVVVRFFLAPKYNSKGYEMPLHENTANFFQLDQFVYDLPVGESVIKRQSDGNVYTIDKWTDFYNLYVKAENAMHGKGQFVVDLSEFFAGFPNRLMLPKGRLGGMPFIFMVYISEYIPPHAPYGTGANPPNTYGIGTGSRRMTSYPLNFPLDRPLNQWQVEKVSNMNIQEVIIHHKPTPELNLPYTA